MSELSLTERNQRLAQHMEDEHGRSHLAEFLQEIVYGGIDGIVTTFAVVAGFTGAALSTDTTTTLSFLTVLLFGLANLFADGLSMGLGNFLSVRSDQDVYRAAKKKERHEVQHNATMEALETVTILENKGFSNEDAKTLTAIYQKNEDYWVDWMMTHELEMPDPTGDNPLLTGFATFISFLIFGFVPLVPFIIFREASAQTVFIYSSIGALLALIALGLLKWRVIGGKLVRSVIEVVLVGGVAAVVAFLVGVLFKGL